ncbi:MAG: hypothetical protein H7274_22670 [Rhodoferax sp.]|nr:hypothetical protein [Rhodoferax sp.]
MKPIWTYPLTWCAVVVAASVLAVAAPRETGVMGRLPNVVGQTIDQRPAVVKHGGERILALITFNRGQRKDAESWISGLQLQHDQSIAWIRMPVVNDNGDPARRVVAEGRLMAHYASPQERANLLPVFVDRDTFAQSAGLLDTDSAYVLVINRNGDVFARVAGKFDEDKAQSLRETLRASHL